mgnify:FL=1
MYDDKRKAKPDPDVQKYLQKSRALSDIMPNKKVVAILSCRNIMLPS